MHAVLRITFLALTLAPILPWSGMTQDAPSWGVANVGVLAHRGTGDFAIEWAPLRHYLDESVPGWRFQFTPVTLGSARNQLENRDIDFLITNPGHYIALERDFPLSVLATRVRQGTSGEETRAFGSVIFTAAGSNIEALRDIRGRSVIAVDATAFGGFQVAWHEFDKQGIDLFRDPTSLAFSGFPQDQIVMRVVSGQADVGIVRSGLLEAMSREGRINLADVAVLNPNADYGHPNRLSTRLYPEWPFLAIGGTDATLRNAVARALLDTWTIENRARHKLPDSWEAPVSYHAVRDLLIAYDEARRPGGRLVPWWGVVLASLSALALGAVLFVSRRRRPLVELHQADVGAMQAASSSAREGRPSLTRREAEVLDHICDGRSTKEIAKALEISPKTVEFHRSNLLRKFGVHSSLQLVKAATDFGT